MPRGGFLPLSENAHHRSHLVVFPDPVEDPRHALEPLPRAYLRVLSAETRSLYTVVDKIGGCGVVCHIPYSGWVEAGRALAGP